MLNLGFFHPTLESRHEHYFKSHPYRIADCRHPDINYSTLAEHDRCHLSDRGRRGRPIWRKSFLALTLHKNLKMRDTK